MRLQNPECVARFAGLQKPFRGADRRLQLLLIFERGAAGFGENDTQFFITDILQSRFQQFDSLLVFLAGNEIIRLGSCSFYYLTALFGDGFFLRKLQELCDLRRVLKFRMGRLQDLDGLVVAFPSQRILCLLEILSCAAFGAFALDILAHDKEQRLETRLRTCFCQCSFQCTQEFFAAALLQEGTGVGQLFVYELLALGDLTLLFRQSLKLKQGAFFGKTLQPLVGGPASSEEVIAVQSLLDSARNSFQFAAAVLQFPPGRGRFDQYFYLGSAWLK